MSFLVVRVYTSIAGSDVVPLGFGVYPSRAGGDVVSLGQVYTSIKVFVLITASFYGASHVFVPVQDASSDTDIFFRFKTHRADALLFLAAGPPDYCLLTLQAGEIKVRINLGSGEEVLTSVPGLKLNDLLWHEIEIQRISAELTLRVDGIHTTYLDISGRFFELNIKSGIFVGGINGFDKLFLGNFQNFRGCLDEFFFNDNDILRLAANSENKQSVYGITWDCSEEFEATSHQPISFIQEESFVALPAVSARNGGSISFDVKTQSRLAVLFYNSGNPSKTDFLAIEIISGKVTLSVNEGNGVVMLTSDKMVNNGLWHHVDAQFSPTYVELTVDGESKNIRPGLGKNRFFDLTGYLYVGGIEPNKKFRALQHGLQSVLSGGTHSSLAGCLKNIKTNNQVKGHREIEISHRIRPDCVWQYPCLQNPCIQEAECFQEGLNSFRCMCDKPVCVRSNFTSGYKLFTKSSLPIDLEILSLNPLEVAEGGNDLLTSEHIKVVLDYQKYGVRESGVLFHIVEPPEHGSLEIEIWRKIADNIFTLLDLYTDKVRYTHDGSENHSDKFVIELEFQAQNYRLPPFLEERHRFVFHIKISPVNDPPKLKVSSGNVLRLAKYTKMPLTSDILNIEDPDNEPSSLVYSVLNIETEEEGYLENIKDPRNLVTSFTQEDIINKQIYYVHKGPPTSRIALRVSDGIETGQTFVLRVETFDLTLSLVNNTGIILPLNSYTIITPNNLTFVTNSPDQDLEIRYDITRLPQHGSIQKRRNKGRWRTINHFTQKQINKGKVRYIHTLGKPSRDEFKFSISCLDIKIPTIYDFHVQFIAVSLTEVNNKELVLDKITHGVLTSDNLYYQTSPVPTNENEIHYTILSIPLYGHLYLSTDNTQIVNLQIGSEFTQEDIEKKLIKYALLRNSYSMINDSFQFQVSCVGIVSKMEIFSIKHLPVDTGAVINVGKLQVIEGEHVEISKRFLLMTIPNEEVIIYNVTTQPQHGILRLMNTALTAVERDYPTSFTNDDIEDKRLFYIHDDSEHNKDKIHFIAFPEASDSDFVYYGTLHIEVKMKNDNPPVRTIDKIFYVKINGERKLTSQYLKYEDLDIDSKPTDIQYTRKGIPNGALFHVDSPDTEIFQFTQEDLNNEKIIFRHNGAHYGKAVLWITDGQFYATGNVKIRASDPFINVTTNTGLIVRRGDIELITSKNLSIETNVGSNLDDVMFKIISRPKHGEILIKGSVANQFKHKDLDLQYLEYENDNSQSYSDFFQFLAFVEDVSVEGTFNIQVFPESYWEPPRVLSNRTIHVDEGKAVVIDPASLNIAHININPTNITYIITVDPEMGFIRITNKSSDEGTTTNRTSAKRFTQAMINEGHIEYVQTKSNVSFDHFTFDVTNGITTISGLQFTISILSNIILLKTGNITVAEGEAAPLNSEVVNVANPYYNDWLSEYLVIEEPQHGHLTNINVPGSKLMKFTSFQLKNGLIQYVHDGTEVMRDWFTVVAKAKSLNKESAPSTIHVMVTPINDETPHLINNTGLEVWEGSLATITNHHLAAGDDDSEPEDIIFEIFTPSNGYVSYKNDTRSPIRSFTQDDINRELVVFVHTGEATGGFRIQVSDGVNKGSPHVFTVTARELKLVLQVNEKLSVLPGTQQSITRAHLLVTTNDKDSNRKILYYVRKEPENGRILLGNPNGALSPVTRFTQSQIDKNMILYDQAKPMIGFTTNDTVVFDIDTEYAEVLKNVVFTIEISVDNLGIGNLEGKIQLNPVDVIEGGQCSIGPEHIDLSQILTLWQSKKKEHLVGKLEITVEYLPSHGWLSLNGRNITKTTNVWFNKTDIRDRLLKYHHDNSDTFSDEFILGFYLVGEENFPNILLYNETLHVNVSYVNDQPFELITKTPKLNVVRGQKMIITSEILFTKDSDGVPEDIIYEIISNATNGFLSKRDYENHIIQNFTQDDIDKNLVYFVHDGSKRPGTFHFKVSDGKYKPVYKAFNIHVVPLSLTLVNKTTLELLQGHTTVSIGPQNLGAATNGDPNAVLYHVTKAPKYGRIFIRENIVTQFKQSDIIKGLVIYMQLDMTVSRDQFVVEVIYGDNILPHHITNVTVVPLVKQGPFNVYSDDYALLTLDVLDASKLAEQTDSNPIYSVTKQPKYGYLQKLTVSRVKRQTEVVETFTHEDITQKGIIYKSKDIAIQGSVSDEVEYMLSAPGVQPAHGKFVVTLQPKDQSSTVHPTSGVSLSGMVELTQRPALDKKEREENVHTPQISDDHVLIIGLVVGMLLLAIIILLILKCYITKRRSKGVERGHSVIKQPGSHVTQTGLNDDHLPSNGSASMSDELPPPPVPPTSPSSPGSRCSSVTPKRGAMAGRSKNLDLDPPLPPPPPPPYDLDGSEWTEVSSTVPTCKVTPLGHPDRPDVNETALNASYSVVDPSELSESEDWSQYDDNDIRYGASNNPVLRKNQYWV
ncbi:chondroitin sulfate proteoglycan 4-like [Limulus polyphemus]|uniref:Chondroitin sulfate proteoglycan 4-like n=1 Tax=Limulus polyphemus TaxID=6850 RepID=A0ABM1SRF8_LIMPO|nr:chondroitin sulfate proteoglycan 4-like [Limulus polyphemus]